MWNKTLLTLAMISPFAVATHSHIDKKAHIKTYSEADVKQLEAEWQAKFAHQLQTKQKQHTARLQQREYFLQIESILKAASAQKQLTAEALYLSKKLIDVLGDYPLKVDAEWLLLNTKLSLEQATDEDLQAFKQKYPDSPYQTRLNQLMFERLYQQQKFSALLAHAKTIAPENADNQCRVFSAQYQQFMAQQQNKEAQQDSKKTIWLATMMQDLLAQFEKMWLKTAELPQHCADIEQYWRDQGRKTDENIRLKAVELAKQNAKKGFEILDQHHQNSELSDWLAEVSKLTANVKYLPTFVEMQPLTAPNKALILAFFPKFIKTLSETLAQPNFDTYQAWADKWQLSTNELREWKIAFISRLFDNQDPNFNIWRDKQLAEIQTDSLIERRIRMALWQQQPLAPWLALLSSKAQEKAEWRYWLAKTEQNQQKQFDLFTALSKERGFYPLLAAQQLSKSYTVKLPTATALTQQQLAEFQPKLDYISEWRAINRFDNAKSIWLAWLKTLFFEQQLALSDYAKQQDWYDLAVEATIQAKAWDYLTLRLPQAYSQWFDLHLTEQGVSKTFAMAIARQESAWSPQAKSSADAIGLMQMLPSTAKLTAQNRGLPFTHNADLLDPFKNIMLGIAHLNELNEKYPNNRILIAAAYNAGANRVDKWLARSNGKLNMAEFIAAIPFFETRGYVQNVLAYDYYYQILQNHANKKAFLAEELKRKY
ncbi:transglycosylase SLT domain-containing protein [[Haemophilus] ducreyi]|uniref:transglycosylase SLT domain-containing protein n=1 Tax=Haemophilus ducreyi TaxID=730 RepID=UPI000655D189|nr:transglycosylase SLT domain-containing protein [[Haemophilus] ducreyi]AKO45606.1 lytic murein transglycosylase [[Haemophilus] ducreyi]AKO46992.1 lytic murein transglycosylase [[Haemophilus] ducreyi]AKO48336.1 lytic murein transglycosylase [[Haemophilus] ducreyi]AKO49724.1 lytic murein transglycosylase [[Haemophilus] ducreyi]ANF61328.1 lytic murein transglycosylase [[Haemophilus] ducreyi]